MGSLRFIDTNPSAAEQVSIAVAEYLTNDSDGIPVLATLYALPGGSLYEIDIRKADFSPMRHFP